ncbi:MAG: hypothetical protein CL613_05055 [Aquimarina sp.]|nr:hypothetical protein [Aquimarina sp.]
MKKNLLFIVVLLTLNLYAQNPVAICQDITVQLDGSGSATISASDIDGGSSDSSGSVTLSIDNNSFTCSNLGTNIVTLTVTSDGDSSTDSCTATVTVADSFSPVPDGFSYIPTGLPSAPQSALTNVAEADKYGVLYELDITSPANYTVSVPYTTNNSALTGLNPERIAYYLQLDDEWIWVSLDDFTGGNLAQMGVPSANGNPVVFNNQVTNMNVFTNKSGVTTGTGITTGNVEMWAGNYNRTADESLGGSSTTYDFDDTQPASGATNGYGSFQVHNYGIGETLFAFNNFNTPSVNCDLGIGSNTGTHPDYTTENNGATYTLRKLYILISNGTDIQLADINDECSATPSIPTATDNCGGSVSATSSTNFPITAQGTTEVTWTFTDASGNSSTAKQNVTLLDDTAPAAIAQDITIQLDNTGNASITAAQIDNGSNDSCGIASLSVSPDTFTCAEVGDNTVTLTVTDNNGNESTTTATVAVEDNVAPTVVAQNITVQLDITGNITITAAEIDNGSSDNCAIASLSLSETTFNCTNIGVNAVTLTATDNNGNQASATANITVEDSIAPTALTQDITVQLDNTGNVSITAAQIDNGSSDVCGIASLSINTSSFTCSDVGNNVVTLTVTDNNGNESTETATVTVEDATAPTPISQDITIQLDNTGNATITAEQIDNGSSDVCGISTITVSPNAFSCSDIGANAVTLTVTDVNGNQTSTDAIVTVEDTIAPNVITQDLTVQLDLDGNATLSAAQVDNGSTDACGISSLAIDQTLFTCDNLGTNSVLLTVTDTNGNQASANATITVEDTIAPIADLANLPDINAQCEVSTLTPPTAIDNCGGIITASSNAILPINVQGTTMITWTYEDQSGNTSTQDQNIIIEDTTVPTVITQNVTLQLDELGNASLTSNQINNGSIDNCGIDTITLDIDSFSCSDVGDNTVTLTVTDVNGNQSSAQAIVTVEDNIAPVYITSSLPDDITVGLTTDDAYELEDFTVEVEVTDNCDIVNRVTTISQSPVAGTLLEAGDHIITISAIDDTGNVEDYEFTITVDATLGVDDFTQNDFKMYPNPTRGIVQLGIEVEKITILDYLGKEIIHFGSVKTIDLSSLEAGVYFVRIETDKGLGIKRIIKL